LSKVLGIGLFTFLLAIVVVSQASAVEAASTNFTFVSGSSSRPDSNVHLGLASGAYVYTPLTLMFGSAYSCNYTIIVNGSVYSEGYLDVSTEAIRETIVNFPESGAQDFRVIVGNDIYLFKVIILKRSYESQVVEEYAPDNETAPVGEYFQSDLVKVFAASLVGTVLAIALAYWFKIDKIKQEPRRLI